MSALGKEALDIAACERMVVADVAGFEPNLAQTVKETCAQAGDVVQMRRVRRERLRRW